LELLKSKVGTGIELPLPDSERWFRAHVDGDDIIVESAELSGVSGTPTFFVNGRRHHGAFDLASLTAAVRAARAQAALSASG